MRTINCNHNMSETWQSFCDSISFGRMNDFIIEVKGISGSKSFYFHNPKVTEYKVSVFRSAFNAYPEEFTITSDSGLVLKYNRYGATITNTKRTEYIYGTDGKLYKKHQYFYAVGLASFAC